MTQNHNWTVRFEPSFTKSLKKLDKPTAHRILNSLERLEKTDTPHSLCKALTGEFSGLWRYRIGNYRVIIDFHNENLIIVALDVAHRSKIYR